MNFSVELYETQDGRPVVQEELEAIRYTNSVLFELLVTGLEKLARSEFHHLPLCRPMGDGLFELRVGDRNIARAAWFFLKGQRIVVVRCFIKKSTKWPPDEVALAHKRRADYLSRG